MEGHISQKVTSFTRITTNQHHLQTHPDPLALTLPTTWMLSFAYLQKVTRKRSTGRTDERVYELDSVASTGYSERNLNKGGRDIHPPYIQPQQSADENLKSVDAADTQIQPLTAYGSCGCDPSRQKEKTTVSLNNYNDSFDHPQGCIAIKQIPMVEKMLPRMLSHLTWPRVSTLSLPFTKCHRYGAQYCHLNCVLSVLLWRGPQVYVTE